MIQTDPIFLGVVPSGARNYVARELSKIKKPLFNPCAGRFSIVAASIADGIDPRSIVATDIGLFSSMIGYLADPDKQIDELEIRILDDALPPADAKTSIDFAAHVMMILKLNQIKQTNLRGLYLREELLGNWARYCEGVSKELEALVAAIKGIHYEMRDIWDVIAAVGDQDVAFFASVPHYANGYERMFAAPNLKWAEPAIPQFDPEKFPEMLTKLGEAKCAAMLCRRGEWTETVPPPWKRVFGRPESREKALWIMANRSMQTHAENKTSVGDIRKFAIYDDHEIAPESKITVINCGMPTILYYRDLFVHRLGATNADTGFLVLVDGQVMTAFGLFMSDFRQFRTEYLVEMFGITRSSKRYKRLGKLFMLLLTSAEMKQRICNLLHLWLHEPKGIRTTSITMGHEGKTDRSALKLVHREKLPDGRFRLIYQSDFTDKTFSQVIEDWLKKHGEKTRDAEKTEANAGPAHAN